MSDDLSWLETENLEWQQDSQNEALTILTCFLPMRNEMIVWRSSVGKHSCAPFHTRASDVLTQLVSQLAWDLCGLLS